MTQLSGQAPRTEPGFQLPAKVVVSLRAGVVLAIANVICVCILALAWTKVRAEPKTIQVTGSARKAIQSDLIVLNIKVSAMDAALAGAYEALSASTAKTIAFLRAHDIADNSVSTSAVGTWKRRGRDDKGNETEKVVAYELWQDIVISSPQVSHVAEVGREITELIKDGVVVESNPPTYIYTKLADMKVTMLAEATKDATARAQQIAGNSGARLGHVMDARMGVMQINPLHSPDASDSGMNDTHSFDKEITAVVSARFSLD